MSYQRGNNLDKNLIFQEYFNDEQSVRRNGGVPTDVVFDKGVAEFNGSSSNLFIPKRYADVKSLRIKVSNIIDGNSDILSLSGVIRLLLDGSNIYKLNLYNGVTTEILSSTSNISTGSNIDEIICTWTSSVINLYINGILEDTEPTVALPVFSDFFDRDYRIGASFGGGSLYYNGNVNSVEFYNKALTAEEVSNLYSDARYFVPSLGRSGLSKILHVTAKDGVARNLLSGDVINIMDVGKGVFDSGTDSWVANGANTIENDNGALKITYIDNPNGAQTALAETGDLNKNLIIGDDYKVIARVKVNSGASVGLKVYDGALLDSVDITSTDWINIELNFTAASVSTGILGLRLFGTGEIFWIDYWYIEHIIPEVVNTDIEVVKDSPGYVPRFNGLTSKVDCGDYNDLTGDITMLVWINAKSLGEGASSDWARIIDNGSLMIRLNGTYNLQFSSDGLASAATDTTEIKENWFFIGMKRTAAGVITVYVNGAVSGTPDQVKGTPVAGASNIIVGNDTASTNTWDGFIENLQVYSGLMTDEEFSQAYTATKHLYNK